MEWQTIDGYCDLYEISDMGDVRGIKSGVTLKPHANKRWGYLQVMLWHNCRGKQHYIHRLVAQHFVNNPNGYKYVTHIDGDKMNNAADNLTWVERPQQKTDKGHGTAK